MGIVVIGAVFVDIKGFPDDVYIPDGRNAGKVEYIHGGVSRNVVEDIANMELRPTFLSIVDESALGDADVRIETGINFTTIDSSHFISINSKYTFFFGRINLTPV